MSKQILVLTIDDAKAVMIEGCKNCIGNIKIAENTNLKWVYSLTGDYHIYDSYSEVREAKRQYELYHPAR